MLRTIAAAFGVVFLTSTLLADDPKTKAKPDAKKVAKETAVTVIKVDADKKTIRVRLLDGRQMDLTVEADTKFMGPKGDMSDQGMKDHRLHAGAPIKVVMDGESLKEVHLPLPNIRERQPGGAKPAAAPTAKPKEDKPKDDKKDSASKSK
jgi:hypothetical protein